MYTLSRNIEIQWFIVKSKGNTTNEKNPNCCVANAKEKSENFCRRRFFPTPKEAEKRRQRKTNKEEILNRVKKKPTTTKKQ